MYLPHSLCGKTLRILALAAALSAQGCDNSSSAPDISAAPASGATAKEGASVIRGRVLLGGNPPAPQTLAGSPGKMDESIAVDAAHGLKNVIVYIANAPPSTFTLQNPVVLDQINCVYVPHVVAVQTGQPLTLKSTDMLMHNVHLQCKSNPDANYGFNTPGRQDIHLKLAETPFKISCDVHPWMTAWMGVFDHPWFAVTADDGSFTIPRVPPGQYKLIAWQEALPQQEKTITVTDNSAADVQFVFPAP